MRSVWTAVLAIAPGLLAGIATVAFDLATRPTCPPPCRYGFCSMILCYVSPVDWTREIAIGAAVGSLVAAIAFLLLRHRAAPRAISSRPFLQRL